MCLPAEGADGKSWSQPFGYMSSKWADRLAIVEVTKPTVLLIAARNRIILARLGIHHSAASEENKSN